MTGTATISDALMVKNSACKCCGGVTVGTVQCGRYMGGRHSPRGNAVTRRAVIGNPGMIERRGHETGRVVADAAILISRQVIAAFTGCKSGVVAGRAVIHDTDMIKGCR